MLSTSFSTSFGSSLSSSASAFVCDYAQLYELPLKQPPSLPSLPRPSPGHSPGPNLQGSWLDIDSDTEDCSPARRKSSGSSMKEAHLRNPLAGIRELTHRSSVHLRKLTAKKSQ
ncbi:hypothetical protein IWQ57_004146 [Coemansia nantahalensis]|uniref:Uncharacterized protein n=1 Tax=Coemansia nantahalensis TaxID=2789366 RepID=A0ACC1JTQ5_9FUNG|nr:hypothetical protein IWQ57_004146 [Coemansia nantahalensis]